MRWLIFLLIVSCGKHQEPKALDLRDNDGDQIVNAQESGIDKYIANIEPMGIISGTLQFQHLNQVEMTFTNQFQTSAEAMVGPELSDTKTYLAEGAKIKVSGKVSDLNFKQESYLVQIAFKDVNTPPEELFIVTGTKEISLGKWSQTMKPRIMAGDLKALILGEAHLSVTKKFKRAAYLNEDQDQTVKEHTYRVFFDNGKKDEVLYVSKEFDIEKLKKGLNIPSVLDVTERDFFFYNLEEDSVRWHQRSFANGDVALVYSSLDELHKTFRKRFQIQSSKATRENGVAKSETRLSNSHKASFYLLIRASKATRTFSETQVYESYPEGGAGGVEGSGINYDHCAHYLRKSSDNPLEEVSFKDVLGQIQISSEAGIYDLSKNDQIEESFDEKGTYWKIKLDWAVENIRIQLLNAPASTYTTTGQYGVKCSSRKNRIYSKRSPVKTNIEAKFILEVESYVEKIN